MSDKITLKVAQKGWDSENNLIPVILLDRKTRTKLGVQEKDKVVVRFGDDVANSYVHVQFKDKIGKGATVNNALAQILTVNVNDEISIEKDETYVAPPVNRLNGIL
jgi:hypothetical protein